MIDKLPLIVFQNLLSFLSFDDICSLKRIRNKLMIKKFDSSDIKYPYACPICILNQPFKKIGFEDDEKRGDKLKKWVDTMNGNFLVQLKYLSSGNGNWRLEKDDVGLLVNRKYRYFGQEIHMNHTICPNYCDDIIKCMNNPCCPEMKNKPFVQDLSLIFHPSQIKIYNEQDFYKHILEHLKFDLSLPLIKTTQDIKSAIKSEFITSSTVALENFRINELETETNIIYEPHFETTNISKFESDLSRLVLSRYFNTREKYLEYHFDFNNQNFKFNQVLDVHQIAAKVIYDLRFSSPPGQMIIQQIKYYVILNILLPNARKRLLGNI